MIYREKSAEVIWIWPLKLLGLLTPSVVIWCKIYAKAINIQGPLWRRICTLGSFAYLLYTPIRCRYFIFENVFSNSSKCNMIMKTFLQRIQLMQIRIKTYRCYFFLRLFLWHSWDCKSLIFFQHTKEFISSEMQITMS